MLINSDKGFIKKGRKGTFKPFNLWSTYKLQSVLQAGVCGFKERGAGLSHFDLHFLSTDT